MVDFRHNYLAGWIVIVVLIAITHVIIARFFKTSPNKALWLWVRIIIACVIGYFDFMQGIRPALVLIIAYTFSGWFLHDVICALGMGNDPWYLNSTGPMDKAQRSIGVLGAFIIKAIGCIGGIAYYYVNYI